MTIEIAGRPIGADHPPFLVAEMSGNHNQSLDRALAIVEAAAQAGAHAIKIQTYTADTITLDVRGGSFEITDPDSLWAGQNLHDLYKQAYTPWEWQGLIMERARDLGLICFSSPFDESAIDFLESIGNPAYKIASFENNHLPLIKKAASTGKPLLISTGMATVAGIDNAVRTARGAGCKDLVLLKCTSTYPADTRNSNIRTIPHLKKLFNCEVGISDHTLGIGAAVASVALGGGVVEKHFTLSRKDGGVDSAFSMEPKEFQKLVEETLEAWKSLGLILYGNTKAEKINLKLRRSIYVVKDIMEGEAFTHENIRIIRPGDGGPPKLYEDLIGKISKSYLAKGTPLTLDKLI